MDEEWISAKDALAFMQRAAPFTDQRGTICKRAHAGLVQARAQILVLPDTKYSDANIGAEFWWAEGKAALEQNWVTGDFSTWIDQKYQVKAFGVSFFAADIYAIVPGAQITSGRWINSGDAVNLVAAEAAVTPTGALAAIIRCCANQLLESRCRTLRWQYADRLGSTLDEVIEDDLIPAWFWSSSASHPDAVLNWKSGNFAGPGETDLDEYCQAQARGVAFERVALSDAIELALKSKPTKAPVAPVAMAEVVEGDKPPLSEAELQKWWTKRATIRDSLTQDELLALIRVAYPDKHISRERIRALTGERKRGPKP
ncbi:hypothetical protein EEB18_001190 [Sphingopyxis sp. OPL5]|uniref:hypothetical protein n=1 Tax=Sphingopyxis sp. OPL5 TaxID=2486273 RepID=UPI00164EC15D|nr:hypothetical protein [Sphingopyxis sp. OPL5]QNO27641.1 hypothetical protein EEB18_001190 [Sphingopyxis sp. OPL5]